MKLDSYRGVEDAEGLVSCRDLVARCRVVVATGVGGLRDAVEDGVTGLLVSPHDAVALREALSRLLADGPRRVRLGLAARQRAASMFSPAGEGTALVEVYREATASPAA